MKTTFEDKFIFEDFYTNNKSQKKENIQLFVGAISLIILATIFVISYIG